MIDKKSHIERYGEAAFHPYHYCLVAMLERYAGFLNRFGAQGDVMAEARGAVEDRQLEAAYQVLFTSGTQFRNAEFFASVLTSRQLKLRKKEADVAGLQVADLLAHPCKQSVLVAHQQIQDPVMAFGTKIVACVAQKYNRRFGNDRVEGYGTIFLA